MSDTTASAVSDVALKDDARVMGLVGMAHASSHFGHMLLPPLFPVFIKDFGLSYAEVGALMSVFFVVSGIGQALAGFVVDKVGARPVLFAALATFALACLAASGATGYSGLLLAAALAGLANSPFHPIDFTILNQRVSAKRLGHAFSVHGLTGSLGWAIAPPLFVGLMLFMPWRQVYWVAAGMYLSVMLILWLNRSDLATTVIRKPEGETTADTLQFLRKPVIWWCFGFFLLSTMTLAVMQSFSVSILKALHGVSFEQATATLTAYMLMSALGMFAGGFVAAKNGPERSDTVVAVCMSTGAALLLLVATGWLGAWGTMALLATTGFAIGIGGPSRDMMIKRATPKGATGRVYGTVYSGLDVGFAIAPIAFGMLMDRGHYSATLVGAACVLLLAVGAARGVGARTQAAG